MTGALGKLQGGEITGEKTKYCNPRCACVPRVNKTEQTGLSSCWVWGWVYIYSGTAVCRHLGSQSLAHSFFLLSPHHDIYTQLPHKHSRLDTPCKSPRQSSLHTSRDTSCHPMPRHSRHTTPPICPRAPHTQATRHLVTKHALNTYYQRQQAPEINACMNNCTTSHKHTMCHFSNFFW